MGFLSGVFVVYILLSLVLHFGELVLNTLFVISLHGNENYAITWFPVALGLLLLPLVMVQLVSAVTLLQNPRETPSTGRSITTALIHVLQLGFVWRHIRIIREEVPIVKKQDLYELCILRLFFGFSASIPLLAIQTYIIIKDHHFGWMILSASLCTLVSVCWTLSSFRRQNQTLKYENVVFSCPGTVFRLLWRLGEIVSRLLTLTVFASVFHYWVFVVLGLHWVTMLICICTSLLKSIEAPEINKFFRFILGIIVSYVFIFCHVNLNSDRSHLRYITYYTIMFFENIVLTTVWYLSTEGKTLWSQTLLFIICASFLVAMLSLMIYYRFFHLPSNHATDSKALCVQDGCINCRLSICVKHSKFLQRPFSAGWSTQYQKALFDGEYYKNLLQDSFIDSMSEWGGDSTTSESNTGLSIAEANKEDNVSPFTNAKKTTTFQSMGTYSHRRFIERDASAIPEPLDLFNNSGDSDSTSHISPTIPTGSSMLDTSDTESDIYMSLYPHHTSKTKLLTESWDNLCFDNLGYSDNHVGERTRLLGSAFRPIAPRNLEDWYSDGYSTDHTETYASLPITVLAKNNRCRYSMASSSTECTMCRNMKSVKLLRKFSKASTLKMSEANTIKEDREIHQSNDNFNKAKIKQLNSKEKCEFSRLNDNKSGYRLAKTNNIGSSMKGMAWYNCSESGDSAYPPEPHSLSTMETTFSEGDGISESSFELII